MSVAVAVDHIEVADGGLGAAGPYKASIITLLIPHVGPPAEEAS